MIKPFIWFLIKFFITILPKQLQRIRWLLTWKENTSMSETSNIINRLLIIKIISEIKQTDARNIQVNIKKIALNVSEDKRLCKKAQIKIQHEHLWSYSSQPPVTHWIKLSVGQKANKARDIRTDRTKFLSKPPKCFDAANKGTTIGKHS